MNRLTATVLGLVALIVAIPMVTVGPAKLLADGRAAQAREAAAAPARSAPAPAADTSLATLTNRARWACSASIEAAAFVPSSVEWVRRSQWPVFDRGNGKWEVVATFKADNRLGRQLDGQRHLCTLRRQGDDFKVR